MSASELTLLVSVFLACAVEAVEALTIVLAVGATRSWRSSLLGALAALLALVALVAAFGPLLGSLPIDPLRAVVGAFLLLFGLQWLRKGLLRASGLLALHREDVAFERETAAAEAAGAPAAGIDGYSLVISFKAVLLEGLEVVLIVLTFGAGQRRLGLAALAATAAVASVAALGVAVRAPLRRVPENTMKLAVGVMLTTFGAFWSAEGVGASWPGGEAALPVLVLALVACSYAIIARLRAGGALARPRLFVPRAAARLGEPWSFVLGDDLKTVLGVAAMLALTALLATVSAAWYAVAPGVLVLLWLSVAQRARPASA